MIVGRPAGQAAALAAALLAAACGSGGGSGGSATATTPATTTVAPATSTARGSLMVTLADGAELVQVRDHDEVHVEVDQQVPYLWVLQCLDDDPTTCWAGVTDSSGTVGPDGIGVVSLRRYVSRTDGEQIDCAEREGRCVLRLATGDEAAEVPGSPVVALSFDPSAPVVPAATSLQVEPSEGLTEGATVRVVVTGVPASGLVDVGLCATGTDACMPLGLGVGVSQGATVDESVVVPRYVLSGAERIDCASAPCEIRLVEPAVAADKAPQPVPVSFVA